jgi:hypothetical protein
MKILWIAPLIFLCSAASALGQQAAGKQESGSCRIDSLLHPRSGRIHHRSGPEHQPQVRLARPAQTKFLDYVSRIKPCA